ncbi:MAG TPA: hypothetical protein VJ914_12900 [Pseudonocardiaceae bacterium]|nr:hypothetical protein [Pseudonocardiaceae bacterium]
MKRPSAVRRCADCGELVGRGYPECAHCTGTLEGPWLADWHALCEQRGVGTEPDEQRGLAESVLATDIGVHEWTCVDVAMSLVDCPSCERELGTGPLGCVLCGIADETRWAWFHEAPEGAITTNEHALRQARVALRAPHRCRNTVLLNWRLALPFLLAGQMTEAHPLRWTTAYLRAGRYDELASALTFNQLTAIRELPWR